MADWWKKLFGKRGKGRPWRPAAARHDLQIDIALRALGGNASGLMLKLFRTIPGTHGILSTPSS